MRLLLLTQAELLKLLRSRVYLVTTAIFVVLAVFWPGYCAGLLALSDNDMCATDALGWPSSLDQSLGFVDGLSTVLMTLLGAWVVGSEFGRDTWKLTLPRMAGRWPFVLAKAVAALGAYLLMGGLAVGGWLLVAAVGGPLAGVATSSANGVQARVDVLALVRAQPEARQAEVLDAYAWADAPDTVRLESQDAPLPDPAVVELDLGAGLSARVPLVVGADAAGTLPRVDAVPPTAAAGRSARDRDVRLAAVVQTAAALDAFHPWVDRDPTAQAAGVAEALQVAAADPGPAAGVWRLLTPLRDGHARASAPPEAARRALPWSWTPTADGLIITAVAPTGSGGIRTGDRVVSWQGQPVADAWAGWLTRTQGGTEGCRRDVAADEALLGPAGGSVTVEVEALDGARRAVTATYDTAPFSLETPRLDPVTRLSAGTWYLDLSRMDDRVWRATVPKLVDAKAIVFDLRVYSGVRQARFLRHLTDTPLRSDTFVLPVWQAPGSIARTLESRWYLPPLAPRLSAQAAFLVGPETISYAETLLGILEAHDLGITVGETSCGTNGNRAVLRLLDGTGVTFTGIDVLGPDGQRRNGVGFAPQHTVAPTRQGILDGRDEVLEAALERLGAGG